MEKLNIPFLQAAFQVSVDLYAQQIHCSPSQDVLDKNLCFVQLEKDDKKEHFQFLQDKKIIINLSLENSDGGLMCLFFEKLKQQTNLEYILLSKKDFEEKDMSIVFKKNDYYTLNHHYLVFFEKESAYQNAIQFIFDIEKECKEEIEHIHIRKRLLDGTFLFFVETMHCWNDIEISIYENHMYHILIRNVSKTETLKTQQLEEMKGKMKKQIVQYAKQEKLNSVFNEKKQPFFFLMRKLFRIDFAIRESSYFEMLQELKKQFTKEEIDLYCFQILTDAESIFHMNGWKFLPFGKKICTIRTNKMYVFDTKEEAIRKIKEMENKNVI